ncbi:MAG: alpha-ketoglutarate-dependent dioxygenase AlkB [Pseudomonadota bacterium]
MKSTINEGFVKAFPPGGLIAYYSDWVKQDRADGLFEILCDELNWQSRSIRLFGRSVMQPRLIHFQGDRGVSYRYSGDDYIAEDWHPEVLALRDSLKYLSCDILKLIERAPQHEVLFNSVLINRYQHGQDSMGWHADNERSLGRNPVIASISLGAIRRFVLRKDDDRQQRFEIRPEHGSLMVMAGDLQHHWQHQLAKTQTNVAERINLTFRTVLA